MNTHPATRKRYASEPVQLSGGLVGILQGIFGMGSPASQLSSSTEVGGQVGGFYALHEGDLFTPGTQNWVLDPSLETPLQTNWGNGFLRRPNTFAPFQPPQVYSFPNVRAVGIGGVTAGQIVTQPLSEYDTAG